MTLSECVGASERILLRHGDLAAKAGMHKPASALFVAESNLEDWMNAESLEFNGLLLQRPCGWDHFQCDIDQAHQSGRLNGEQGKLQLDVENGNGLELEQNLQDAADRILTMAALPSALSNQIRLDVCSIGGVLGRMFSPADTLTVRMEILGENVCSRWHRDNCVGRAIVSYTGAGTVFTDDSNVDFWELENCGKNHCVIRDEQKVHSVALGDVLFIKGQTFPQGSSGLVHKSPEKLYHSDGRIINRLVLKVDIGFPVPTQQMPESTQWSSMAQ